MHMIMTKYYLPQTKLWNNGGTSNGEKQIKLNTRGCIYKVTKFSIYNLSENGFTHMTTTYACKVNIC